MAFLSVPLAFIIICPCQASVPLEPTDLKKSLASRLIGTTITKDYSSPSAAKRSLTGLKASGGSNTPIRIGQGKCGNEAKPALGLGVGKRGLGQNSTSPSHAGVSMASNHKPSSRTSSSTVALPSESPRSDVDATGDEDAPIRVARPLHLNTGASNVYGGIGIKNKLLTRAASNSREFPSPKLGGRSLSATPSHSARSSAMPTQSHTPRHDDDSDNRCTSTSDEASESEQEKPSMARAAPPTVNEYQNESDDRPNLVSQALAKKPDPLARIKQEVALPVTASPKQFKSSLMLLSLAKRDEAAIDEDLTMIPQNGTDNIAVNHALNNLASTTGSVSSNSSTSNTPRPSYLRRLDSPESHHGQLLNAKARLQILISKMLQTMPNIKLEAAPEIREALLKAVEKLEGSCVHQSFG